MKFGASAQATLPCGLGHMATLSGLQWVQQNQRMTPRFRIPQFQGLTDPLGQAWASLTPALTRNSPDPTPAT